MSVQHGMQASGLWSQDARGPYFPKCPFIVCPAPKFYSSFKIQLQCYLCISQQKLNPLPLLHFACMVLYTYFVLLGIPAVIQFCAPTSKKRFFRSGLLSLSPPNLLDVAGTLPCTEQVKKNFRWMGGWGRNPFKTVLTPHKMHYYAFGESS